MKYLIVDRITSQALALRLAEEGEEVFYNFIADPGNNSLPVSYGSGLFEEYGIKEVETWEPYVDKVDVIVFTDVGWGKVVDELKRKGKIVWGSSAVGNLLETSRSFPIEKKLADFFPKTKVYNSLSEAWEALKRKEFKRPVLKLKGTIPIHLRTYVSETVEDAIYRLEDLKRDFRDDLEVVVTEYIDGVEVAVGAFVGPEGFVLPWNMNFEHKRLFPGDIGPLTGEMGTVIFNADLRSDVDTLFQFLFGRREWWYARYYGAAYVDMNLIVSAEDGKPYFLEFTARFGYPHLPILLPSIKTPIGKILHDVPKGIMKRFEADPGWVVGVSYAAKGYPFTQILDSDLAIYTPIVFKKEPDFLRKHLPENVYKDGNGVYRVCPRAGRVLNAVGLSPNLRDAIRKAYEAIKEVSIPDGYYRNDIGQRLFDPKHGLPLLYDYGYISSKRLESAGLV